MVCGKCRLLMLVGVLFLAWQVRAEDNNWPKPMFPKSGCWGLVVHQPGDVSNNTIVKMCKKLGVQWVRESVRWSCTEIKQRGNYEWGKQDALFKLYKDNGINILCILTLEDLCSLYEKDQANKDLVIDAIVKWAEATALHYKGLGLVYEIGNEPEVFPMKDYWSNPVTYGKMARKVAAAIKKADPEAKVAAVSMAWFDPGFFTSVFQTGMLKDGNIDIISFHGYHRENMMPESRLASDVDWMRRNIRRYNTKKKDIILIDSERGYAMVPFASPKHWTGWRNMTYSRTEQAAYLARHYLTEISLGIEISVWYKLGWGECNYSLYENGPDSLTPMGYVYMNLAALLSENPKTLLNDIYDVNLLDLPDNIPDPNVTLKVKSYLKTFLKNGSDKKQLIIAMWNPVEAFDGKILESRKRIGEEYHEKWRPISPSDNVEIPVQVRISSLFEGKIEKCYVYNLLAKDFNELTKPLSFTVKNNTCLTETIKIGSMPTVVVLDLKP